MKYSNPFSFECQTIIIYFVVEFKEKELPTLWIFPYFMEPHVKAALPSLTMLDYKVKKKHLFALLLYIFRTCV